MYTYTYVCSIWTRTHAYVDVRNENRNNIYCGTVSSVRAWRVAFTTYPRRCELFAPRLNPFPVLHRNPHPTKIKSRGKLTWKLLETTIVLTTVYYRLQPPDGTRDIRLHQLAQTAHMRYNRRLISGGMKFYLFINSFIISSLPATKKVTVQS